MRAAAAAERAGASTPGPPPPQQELGESTDDARLKEMVRRMQRALDQCMQGALDNITIAGYTQWEARTARADHLERHKEKLGQLLQHSYITKVDELPTSLQGFTAFTQQIKTNAGVEGSDSDIESYSYTKALRWGCIATGIDK